MAKIFKNFINGKWVKSSSGRTVANIDPSDSRKVNGRFQESNEKDTQVAIRAAEKAFEKWKKVPPAQRARIVMKVYQQAEAKKEELAKIMVREEGKILAEARGEITKGDTLLEWYAGEGFRYQGITVPSELPNNFLYTVRKPLGVVAVITPWNFPWAIPCWKIAPALVAGNTVVFKPASNTAWLAVKLTEFFEKAGLPPGVLNLVTGPGSKVGEVLNHHPSIQGISFTGSNAIGDRVNRCAAERGIKVTCEMGGKNPCVIMDDANLNLALGGVMKGAFGNAGQRCTATSRLILHQKIADKFLKKLVPAIRKMTPGSGLNPRSTMGPVVDKNQYETVKEYLEIGHKEGKCLIGGTALADGVKKYGFFIAPTVFDRIRQNDCMAKEEIFGPVLSVLRVRNYKEAMEVANNCSYGLSSSIFTNSMTTAMRFVEDMEAGMIHLNSPTIGGEAQVPFGGVKGTGVGDREMAKDGINFFTEQATVFVDYTGGVRNSNIY